MGEQLGQWAGGPVFDRGSLHLVSYFAHNVS